MLEATHPQIPPNHKRFSTGYVGVNYFLTGITLEDRCAEFKRVKQTTMIDELRGIEKENATCVARCAWIDEMDRHPRATVKWFDAANQIIAWKAWGEKTV